MANISPSKLGSKPSRIYDLKDDKVITGSHDDCFETIKNSAENKLGHDRFQNKLNSIRGLVATTMIGAYVTTSIEAASVLANIPPMELLIMEALDVKRDRAGQNIDQEGFIFHGEPRLSKIKLKGKLKERTLLNWQRIWDVSDKGRVTHRMFPNVIQRQNNRIKFNAMGSSWKHLKQALEQNKSAKLRGYKLEIEGRLYTARDFDEDTEYEDEMDTEEEESDCDTIDSDTKKKKPVKSKTSEEEKKKDKSSVKRRHASSPSPKSFQYRNTRQKEKRIKK
ncbi:unnamed protein product [Ceutorhynchus assimilis]|uniref:Uncharacterized protein n=1 Tax=Ceutorhynchus assimilis TaxID=467358 RepID=A0A9N9MTK8_9CUCU|nr:unnamed protein product [Ceutorhynchus assimilis]